MTQEEKELLLKDLCRRLPYGVKAKRTVAISNIHTIDTIVLFSAEYFIEFCKEDAEFTPYLRTMSSMSDDEEDEYNSLNAYEGQYPRNEEAFDWLLSHHFDYCGLISKGLALEAPEGMYD